MSKVKVVQAFVIEDKISDFDHNAFLYDYKVNGELLRAVHWSGRFDGSVHHLVEHLYYLASKYDPCYITTTETQQRGARKLLASKFGPNWGLLKTGEYVVLFKKKTFRTKLSLRPHVIVSTRIKNLVAWRQMHIGFFNLYHRDLGIRFRLLSIHGPSGIQQGSSFRPGKQSDVAKKGWPRVGRSLKRFEMLHPKAVQIVVADSNADHFLRFWRRWFEVNLGTKSIWSSHLPSHGTHRDRLIDVAWIKSRVNQ